MYRYKNIIFILYLSVVVIYFFSKVVYSSISPYPLGDIMINYHYGFIRRGLIGTVFSSFRKFFNFNYYLFVNYTMSLCYIVFFTYIAFKIWSNKLFLLVIFTSPFGLSFILNDWSSFGYKDIILLINFIAANKIQKIENAYLKNILLITNIILGTLIHENYLFLSVPFILLSNDIDNYKSAKSKRYNTSLISWLRRNLVLIFTSIFLCLIMYIANHFVNLEIINSLKRENILILSSIKKTNFNLNLALAPLDWLLKDLHYGIQMTKSNYTNFIIGRISFLHIMLLFTYLYIVIEISVGFIYVKSKIFEFCFSILTIFIGYIFVFYIATDWGRWMFLFFMHFSCLIVLKKIKK